MSDTAYRGVSFSGALATAVLLHASIALLCVQFTRTHPEQAQGTLYDRVAFVFTTSKVDASNVEQPEAVVETGISQQIQTQPSPTAARSTQPRGKTTRHTSSQQGNSAINSQRGHANGSAVLADIRARILRARIYPRTALRRELEGTVVVRFTIESDGSVKNASVRESSGALALDHAALQTVARATPFPAYADEVIVPIRYSLD